MLAELLAVTSLGMAYWSSRHRDDREEERELQKQLMLGPTSRQVEPIEDAPSLFSTMELCSTIYAVAIADGYLIDAYNADDDDEYTSAEDRAVSSGSWTSEHDEGTTEIAVTKYECVPTHIAERVMNKDYSDGYGGTALLQKNCTSSEDVWSWNMYEDEDFENWWEEQKNYSRDDFMYNMPEYTIQADGRLFHSTNDSHRWEEDFDPEDDYDGLIFVNKREMAEETLTYEYPSSEYLHPGPKRLLVFKASEPITVYDLDEDTAATFAAYFEVDLTDEEDVAKAFKEHNEHLKTSGIMLRTAEHPDRVTVILDASGVSNLELVDVVEL